MDYISKVGWAESCHAFVDAYVRFRTEGIEAHWFKLNGRNIEIAFLDCSGYTDIAVKLYCLELCIETTISFGKSLSQTDEIIDTIFWLAFDAEELYHYIKSDNSEEAYMQIRYLLERLDRKCYDANMECCLLAQNALETTIKIYGREINVHVTDNDYEYGSDFWLSCINTGRNLSACGHWEGYSLADTAERIMYLALEPECFKIDATNYEWEYELIRAIVAYAIEVCPQLGTQERIIELHGRQIKIRFIEKRRETTKFKERSYYVNASLNCITTGKSCSCDVEAFDKNPEELIHKIQELAWKMWKRN